MAEELAGQYREPFAESFPIRREQHLQLAAYLDRLMEQPSLAASPDAAAATAVEGAVTLDFSSPELYEQSVGPVRQAFLGRLGHPLPMTRDHADPRVELVARDSVADIYRVWLEVLEGVEAYGLYLVPRDLEPPAPLVIAVHGGSGCPEAICDLDTRVNYHAFGREAARRGYVVWAPGQAMQVTYGEDPGIEGADRELLEQKANRVGLSVEGIEVHKILRGVDAILEHRPEPDPARVAMAGLSWGGTYTLLTMAASRVVGVGVVSGIFGHGRSPAAGGAADDWEVSVAQALDRFAAGQHVGLACPRPLMIQNGATDGVVSVEGARAAIPAARRYYERLAVEERFVYAEHGGGHEFQNESIFAFLSKHL